MTTTAQGSSGGGWFSKLVVVALLALAIGLYLQIVILQPQAHRESAASQVDMPRVEAATAPAPAAQAAPAQGLRDLPEDQMSVIRRVFAPEMGD